MSGAFERSDNKLAVVIPCFNVASQILGVLKRIGPEVARIYVVDDRCPQDSGGVVERGSSDPRVTVIHNTVNKGVGGAVLAGMCRAVEEGATILVKLDGDGQMDPALIPGLVAPIQRAEADYTKGNRFYELEGLREMPTVRVIGNAGLSFLSKASSGYWDIFDPTNGFVAIHHEAFRRLPISKLDQRYFFESDLLFRLYLIRAVVLDIPMTAKYADEVSGFRSRNVILPFFRRHSHNPRAIQGSSVRDRSRSAAWAVRPNHRGRVSRTSSLGKLA